jgi:hypothetical protein
VGSPYSYSATPMRYQKNGSRLKPIWPSRMQMLGDKALCGASRSFASGVSRYGELAHAADLIEQAV